MNPIDMGLTTERKIFLALALVAGTSLIVDQAILSPSSAGAAPLNADQVNALPNEPIFASITKPITKSVTQIFNERLSGSNPSIDQSIDPADLQKMFAPLVKPAPKPLINQTPISAPQTAVAVEPTQQIPTNLPILSAVMPSRSGHSGAILNATLYQIGQATPDGYRLISVEQRQVLVGYKDQEFWLTLPAFED